MSKDPRELTLRKVSKVAFVLVILFLLVSSLVRDEAGSMTQHDNYSVRDVVSVLFKEGLILTRDYSFDGTEYKIRNTEPIAYKLNNQNQYLLIYPYDSIGEREIATGEFHGKPREIFIQEGQLSVGFTAKNMIVIYMGKPFSFKAQNTELKANLDVLSKTIFFELNKGTELLYRGESENWEAGLLVTYYENWWKDEQGTQRYESWSNDHEILRYKGNPDEVGKYEFRFEYPGRAFGGASDSFRQGSFDLSHNYGRYGGRPLYFWPRGSGGGFIPMNGTPKVTIKWQETQEEVVELKLESNKINEGK